MSTRRKLIRQKVVSILKRSAVVRTQSVSSARNEPYEVSELPAISVYSNDDEVVSKLGDAPREIKREVEIMLDIVVIADNDEKAADELDDMCEEIEDVLSSHPKLTGGKVDGFVSDDFELERVSLDQDSEEHSKPVHSATMTWIATYTSFMPRDRKFVEQKDFEQANADWRIGHHDGDPDMVEDDSAKDEVDIPQ